MRGFLAHSSAFPHRGHFIRADMCICANSPVRHAIFVVIGKRSVCKAVLSQRKGRATGCAMQLVERGRNSRSEESRVGKECVSTCRSGGAQYHLQKKTRKRA